MLRRGCVVVVPVVVGMGVLMFHGQMFVRMRMQLHKVKQHARKHEYPPTQSRTEPARSHIAMAPSAPMKGANAKTDPVHAAPKRRCASR